MRHEEIEFLSDGVVVRGDFCCPDGDGPFPAVVMAGGWLYVKEFNQPTYAAKFAEMGIASVRFDYRGFGASDGALRQHVDPRGQIEDLRNGLSYLENRLDVDATRLGVWGISFGGGHALTVGAIDPRVRCVVSTVPMCDGFEGMRRLHGTLQFRALQDAILRDRRERFKTGQYGYNDFAGEDRGLNGDVSTVPINEVKEVFETMKATMAPRIEMRQTLASTEALLQYTVFPYLRHLVEKPVLMIVAEGDDVTWVDIEVDAFNQIPCPTKKLLTLPGGVTHSSLYRDRSPVELSAQWGADWLAEHLGQA